tara:strand:+ start:5183 stop:6910 length:1728 start_codon:yes stop_codon:yes gene_type:complete
MSSPDINYPSTPSYGESLAEALKAQAEFLKGTGDFADIGSLESLLPLEESVRRKTAQTDTDVLRQTLLGTEQQVVRDPTTGKFGIPGTEVVTQADGNKVEAGGGRFQLIMTDPGETSTQGGGKFGPTTITIPPTYKILDTTSGGLTSIPIPRKDPSTGKIGQMSVEGMLILGSEQIQKMQSAITEAGGNNDVVTQTFDFVNPVTGEQLQPGETVRTTTGMVDLLGDTRELKQFETRTATAGDVAQGLAEEVGDQFVAPSADTRRAGFDDKGNFLGLSVLAEDIQRGNLSRQREADLQDVSRLSGLYQGIMEDYKPGTASAMQGAKDLIEEQKDNLLRDVGISDPAQVQARGVQADPLRQGLMTQAEEALGQGLTDREERQIAEAARARSTLMGRTFDQSGAIAEAEARVAEDNQRKMQNRAFAQSVLGQEAGIQTADDTRRIGADQFNVGSKMDAERLRESLRQQGLLGYLDAASRISQIENQDQLDPFQAILGRGGGTALQQGQQVFGQAGYGLQSGPQYLNPEAGLGYISQMAANQANMYGAQQAAAANRQAGIFGGLGAVGGGLLGNAGLFS